MCILSMSGLAKKNLLKGHFRTSPLFYYFFLGTFQASLRMNFSGLSFRDFATLLMKTTVLSSPTGAVGLMQTILKLYKNALKRKSVVTIFFVIK